MCAFPRGNKSIYWWKGWEASGRACESMIQVDQTGANDYANIIDMIRNPLYLCTQSINSSRVQWVQLMLHPISAVSALSSVSSPLSAHVPNFLSYSLCMLFFSFPTFLLQHSMLCLRANIPYVGKRNKYDSKKESLREKIRKILSKKTRKRIKECE